MERETCQGLSVPAFIDCRGFEGVDAPPRGPKRNLLLDVGWWKKYHACWSIPLAKDGKLAGVIQLGFSKFYEWLPREQELLAAAAERCTPVGLHRLEVPDRNPAWGYLSLEGCESAHR